MSGIKNGGRSAVQLKVSLIVPVFNERDTILEVLRRVRLQESIYEIIVVDDGSTDGTRDILAGEVNEETEGVVIEYLNGT